MNKQGPVILIEDDEDDRELFLTAFHAHKYPNEIILFGTCDDAVDYLSKKEIDPFLIFCDINLPNANGLELRDRIECSDVLRKKFIPFIFLTSSTSSRDLKHAFDLTIQGYFLKPYTIKDFEIIIECSVKYWSLTLFP